MNHLALVSGLGRCGTSLVMQMLAAGGAQIAEAKLCIYPDFEHRANVGRGRVPPDAAGVLKWLDPHKFRPPAHASRAVFMTRDLQQQARSQVKMVAHTTGVPMAALGGRGVVREMEASLRREQLQARHALECMGCTVVSGTFEELLASPECFIARAALELGVDMASFDARRARDEVIPRDPGCLDEMLETELLRRVR